MRIVAALVFGFLAVPAQASDVTQKDIQVIGRALGFIEDPPTGPMELGIVYIRNNADALRQATDMQALLADAPIVGKITLKPHLVAVDELARLEHISALFVVPAASQAEVQAAAVGKQLRIPVISTDPGCAASGYCVLSVSSSPTVEIVLNRTSAEATGVRFTPAFRMLVKKL